MVNYKAHYGPEENKYAEAKTEKERMESAHTTFIDNLHHENPKLVTELISPNEASWIKNTERENTDHIYEQFKNAMAGIPEGDKQYATHMVADAMIKPAVEYINTSETDVKWTGIREVRDHIVSGLEAEESHKFHEGIKELNTFRDEAIADRNQYLKEEDWKEIERAAVEKSAENLMKFFPNQQGEFSEEVRQDQNYVAKKFMVNLRDQHYHVAQTIEQDQYDNTDTHTTQMMVLYAARSTMEGEGMTSDHRQMLQDMVTELITHPPEHVREKLESENPESVFLKHGIGTPAEAEVERLNEVALDLHRIERHENFWEGKEDFREQILSHIETQKQDIEANGRYTHDNYPERGYVNNEALDETPLTYREVLREETQAKEEPTSAYRELLKEQNAEYSDEHKQTPLERWNQMEHPESMEAYTEQAEDQLKILSAKPANIGTFLKGIREQLTGNFQDEKGYDLSESAREEITHKLMENLRDSYPDLVPAIAQGNFPDMDGWKEYTKDNERQSENYPKSQEENRALYDALQEAVNGLKDTDYDPIGKVLRHEMNGLEESDYDPVREHLRHAVTELMTRPTQDVINQFKADHRGWKPSSLEDEMLNTQDLARETVRLQNAAADIGWGGERNNESHMWEQIRHDLLMKEIEVRDEMNKHHFQPKSD